jgi:hypothetical protein
MAKLTNTIILAAIDSFEAQKKSIDVQIEELRAMLTGALATSDRAIPAHRLLTSDPQHSSVH